MCSVRGYHSRVAIQYDAKATSIAVIPNVYGMILMAASLSGACPRYIDNRRRRVEQALYQRSRLMRECWYSMGIVVVSSGCVQRMDCARRTVGACELDPREGRINLDTPPRRLDTIGTVCETACGCV